MAVTEGLLFNSIDLNDGVNFTIRGLGFPVPKKRQEWVQGADADGAALVRDPLFDMREIPIRLRINPAGSLTMDQALAKVGQLVDQIEEAERQVDGLPVVWTPAQGTKSLTFYALSGEITDNPIEKSTQNSGYFLKAPMIGFRLDCKPFGYGQTVDSIADDFSSNTIGNYTFDTGGATLSVSGGQLVPSDTTEKRLYRSKEGLVYCDSQVTFKVVTGASVASGSAEGIECRIDASNYLRAGANFSGATSTLTITKVVGGAATALATSATFTTVAATTYWVRMRAEKNLVTVELWTAQPTNTGTAAQTLTYTLAGADATQFGTGITGQSGLRLIPQATDYRYDDFQLEPNIWKSSNPLVIGLVPAITGDVPAEGRLIVTDAAGQSRRLVEFGLEQRYYSPGVPRVLDQFATDTITSGAWTVDLGGGTLSVTGGLLVPSTVAEKRLHRTDAGGTGGTDWQTTVKVVTGASVASGSTGLIARWTADTDFLFARLNFAGATSNLTIHKCVAGTDTTLATSGNTTTAISTSYWVRFVVQGTTLTATYYTADPASGAAATSSVSYTLTTAEAQQFVSGQTGLRLVPVGTDYRWDDFRAQPLAGATDILLDSEDLATSGSAGVQTTQAGAYTGGTVANHVVQAALTTTPVAVCGTGNLGHVGTFRVKVRVNNLSAVNITDVKARLSWKEGDGPLRSNDWATVTILSSWSEIDLGVVSIPPATLGTQRWAGQIEAYSVRSGDLFAINYIDFIPTEVYGKAVLAPWFETISSFACRDEFDQTAGSLAGKTAAVGGVWAGGGSANDFVVDATGKTAQRTAVSDTQVTTGRYAYLSTSLTETIVQVDFSTSALVTGTNTLLQGLLARYVDVNNYFFGGIQTDADTPGSTSAQAWILLYERTGGVSSQVLTARNIGVITPGAWYTLRFFINAGGECYVWFFPQGTSFAAPLAAFKRTALSSGGALASGFPGIYDVKFDTQAITRSYDNFVAGSAAANAVVFSGQSAEINTQKAERADATGSFYGPVPAYRGGRLYLPPAASKGRSSRLTAKLRRNNLDYVADDQIADATFAQLKYTPRFLAIPR
jgi:hypothetical protein